MAELPPQPLTNFFHNFVYMCFSTRIVLAFLCLNSRPQGKYHFVIVDTDNEIYHTHTLFPIVTVLSYLLPFPLAIIVRFDPALPPPLVLGGSESVLVHSQPV